MAYGAIFGQTPKIPEVYNIGDIKATVRTDLGDKWLLCNGDEISSETYPNLDAILRVDPAKLFVTNKFYGNTFEGTYPEERCFNYLFD